MELRRILLAAALALLPAAGQAQQTQSTINPNVPPVGFLVEQSGPQFRANFQAAISDINVLFNRSVSSGLVVGASPVIGSCTTGFNLYNNAGILGCQASGGSSGLTVGTTTVAAGVTQQILYDNAGLLAELTKANSSVLISSGAGVPSWATTLPASLTAPNLTVTGSLVATGLVTNADLVNQSTTVNGQTCTLGAACTISSSAGTITIGVTTIATGTTNQLLYDNGGLLGEVTKGNSCLYGTNGTGVPSCLTALPASLTTPNLTVTGSFTATALVTNADLVNSTTTINGQVCTLGGGCTVPAAAGTLTGAALAAGVTGSSLTSVGTLTGLTSSGQIVINTFAGTMLNATSSNTGGANLLQIGNSGTSTNGSTTAYFRAALTDAGCGTGGTNCDVVFRADGHATTPFADFATGAGLTGGFFIATSAGPIQLNGNANLQFQVTSGAAFDCAFAVAGSCTFTYLIRPSLTTDTAATTTRTVCQNVTGTGTAQALYFGSGAAGVCKGTSAAFMKQNIEPIMYGLPEVMQTNVHSFYWRPGFDHDGDLEKQQVGFIADEIAASMPLFATKDPSSGVAMSVDYMGAMLTLFRSVQQIVETCDVVTNDNFCAELKRKIARQ